MASSLFSFLSGSVFRMMRADSGAWLFGLAVVVIWLIESRHTWREARPRRQMRHHIQPAPVRATKERR